MSNELLSTYPVSSSFGISRGCGVGGRREHKEGRAFDWAVDVGDSADRAAADDFLARLFATDEHGNRHALARRLGVMYVVWNNRIWGSYRADAGWRPYVGDSPHTDHAHISSSWVGGLGETSFWTGVPADLTPVPTSRCFAGSGPLGYSRGYQPTSGYAGGGSGAADFRAEIQRRVAEARQHFEEAVAELRPRIREELRNRFPPAPPPTQQQLPPTAPSPTRP